MNFGLNALNVFSSRRDESKVRERVQPVEGDLDVPDAGETPTADHAPDVSLQESDDNPNLVGLVQRPVASPVTPKQTTAVPGETVDAATFYSTVNVGMSGAPEAARLAWLHGIGPGTMGWTTSFLPTITDGSTFGGESFTTGKSSTMDVVDGEVTPTVTDADGWNQVAMDYARQSQIRAQRDAALGAWWSSL